jgi:RNA polymerase sigma factor (sigma-70 family)
MSSIIKGIQGEQALDKKQPEVQVPGYGTMPLDMLKRHVQTLSKEFNDSIQQGEFLKAAYRTEQFYNALMALAKVLKQQGVTETSSTGMGGGSAGIGGGAGLGIEKSPIEKVLEKPLGEGNLPPKAGFNKNPHKVGPGTSKDDYEYKKFIPTDAKEKGEEWAIARDVRNVNSKLGKKKPKELDTGFYKNYLSNRPVREEELEETSPNQQLSLYNPSGTTYRQQPMPKMEPDPVDKAKPLSRAKNVPADLPDVDDEIRQKQLRKKLLDIIDNDPSFSPRQRYLIKAYYLDGKTFDQLAKELDVSSSRVNQLVKKAERFLRHPERAKQLRPFLLADGQIYSTGGGAGQSYRKYKSKPAGLDEEQLNELSPETLASYKKKAGADASKADKEGDFERGNKRFSGIVRATKKEFDHDAKKVKEEQAPMFTPEENLSELKQDTIDDYISRKSALARGGLPEPSKKFGNVKAPAWKVAAGKIAKPGSEMEKYAKVKATLEGYSYKIPAIKADAVGGTVGEEQAPMFTPEEKMVNANDPMSDGWRVYKAVPAGTKESAIMKGLQTEYKDAESKRVIQFSKENPPSLDYLYQQFIQKMLNPANTVDPNEWIESVNNYYGLNYIWKDYQKRGHKDYTNNWQKIVDKYILKR